MYTTIRKCREDDIVSVHGIEYDIEKSNAASIQTLESRLKMFRDGFLVTEDTEKGKIIGYVESTLREHTNFETFDEIKDFCIHHNQYGKELYIIFLAMDEKYRGNKLGQDMLLTLEDSVISSYGIRKSVLVAKEPLVEYYSEIGYKKIRLLHNFLPGRDYKSILMEKILS